MIYFYDYFGVRLCFLVGRVVVSAVSLVGGETHVDDQPQPLEPHARFASVCGDQVLGFWRCDAMFTWSFLKFELSKFEPS